MLDIAGQMFDERCVKEIFRPQKVFAKRSLRTVFERLAHASIMKLNSTAMDKVSFIPTTKSFAKIVAKICGLH